MLYEREDGASELWPNGYKLLINVVNWKKKNRHFSFVRGLDLNLNLYNILVSLFLFSLSLNKVLENLK